MVRSRAASEYEKASGFSTPKRPLFERGWRRASADGGLLYSSGGEGAALLREKHLPAHVCDEFLGRWAFARAGYRCPEPLRFRVWVVQGQPNQTFDVAVNLIRRITVPFAHQRKQFFKRLAHGFLL